MTEAIAEKPPKGYRAVVACPACKAQVPIACRGAGPTPMLCRECGAQTVVVVPQVALVAPPPFVARTRSSAAAD